MSTRSLRSERERKASGCFGRDDKEAEIGNGKSEIGKSWDESGGETQKTHPLKTEGGAPGVELTQSQCEANIF